MSKSDKRSNSAAAAGGGFAAAGVGPSEGKTRSSDPLKLIWFKFEPF